MSRTIRQLFPLGRTMMTPGAQEALLALQFNPEQLLARHVMGDWGDLGADDLKRNREALEGSAEDQQRIFSAYQLTAKLRVWVITEWDRSATTILLPEEY